MNDERFNNDLLEVLREAAGDEAPVSLRSRIASITDEAPIGRRLWFSPPMRISLAAAAVVAVLVLAFVLMQPQNVGPGPSESPATPTPSVEESPSATAHPSEESTPTQVPSSAWVGLEWSDGVVPFAPNTSFISEIQPWGEGYVAVGGTFPLGQGTVFGSTDGRHWSVMFQAELPEGWSFQYVLPLGDGLLAVSDQRGVACEANAPCPPEGFDVAPRLFTSADGENWTQIESQSWRDVVGDMPPSNMIGGFAGVVGIRANGTVVHSTDGRNWQLADLPASVAAIPEDLTAFDGGFVIVGRDGERDPASGAAIAPLPPGTGRPAAWVSPNGVDWTEADVEGDPVPGGELREVAAGANGLFAVGIGEARDEQAAPVTHGWASADGLSWTILGRIGEELPLFGGKLLSDGFVVGDGRNMVIFARQSASSPSVVAYASTDGVEWRPLTFSGAPAEFVLGVWGETGPGDLRYLTDATVVPDGVIATVYSGDVEFWFGSATR